MSDNNTSNASTDSKNENTELHCERCREEILKALYQLNVEAKKYADGAASAYNSGMKTVARSRSLRKKSLYGLKTAILREFVESGCVDSIKRHEIDGKLYYCFYIGDFSFHSPVSEWSHVPVDAPSSSPEALESFDTDPANRPDELREYDALARLSDEFESPNDYLPAPFVHSNFKSEFAGWSSLPGAVAEGDRVDGRFGRAVDSPENPFSSNNPFLFEVGDSFQTRERGECRILDRYRAWMPPLMAQSPIHPASVYDVTLDGSRRETVLEDRLVDDWGIMVADLSDPLPDVAGEQATLVSDEIESSIQFGIGDILEVQPMQEGGDNWFCRITKASVSYNLVFCELDPVKPTESPPMSLSVSEFVDDVVAVHDTPPDSES